MLPTEGQFSFDFEGSKTHFVKVSSSLEDHMDPGIG